MADTEAENTGEFPAIPYPWQQSQWTRLLEQYQDEKLPHALMFAGQKGLGKGHLAMSLAQYLLCKTPRSGLACGDCRACALNRAGTHPDLKTLRPEEVGKAVKIDQVRNLAEFVGKTSQQGGYKVAIIEPAESMNLNAANALLKSLEEPSPNTLLILVSHVPNSVMATVRSRCQILSLATPPEDQALPWLNAMITDGDAESLLKFANGAPILAKEMLNGDLLERRQGFQEGMTNIASGQLSPLQAAKSWLDLETIELMDWMIGWAHGLVCYLGTPMDSGSVRGQAPDKQLQAMVGGMDQSHLFRYIDKIILAKRQLLSGANPNKQLLLEELLMDWRALARLSLGRPRQS